MDLWDKYLEDTLSAQTCSSLVRHSKKSARISSMDKRPNSTNWSEVLSEVIQIKRSMSKYSLHDHVSLHPCSNEEADSHMLWYADQ